RFCEGVLRLGAGVVGEDGWFSPHSEYSDLARCFYKLVYGDLEDEEDGEVTEMLSGVIPVRLLKRTERVVSHHNNRPVWSSITTIYDWPTGVGVGGVCPRCRAG